MFEVIRQKHLTSKEEKTRRTLAAQPLDYKSGYTNETFNKLYGDKKNPYKGTERDLKNRKKYF